MSPRRVACEIANLNKSILPDETADKLDPGSSDASEVGDFDMHPLVFTNELHSYLDAGEPGGVNPWHTHRTIAELGQIDFLGNNTGIWPPAKLVEMDERCGTPSSTSI